MEDKKMDPLGTSMMSCQKVYVGKAAAVNRSEPEKCDISLTV